MICLNQAASALKRIKTRRKKEIIDRLGPVYDRVNQSGQGLGLSLVKTGFDLGSKALRSEFGKKLINKGIGIDNISSIFKFEISKIKNKNVREAMTSDIANMVIGEAQNRAKNRCSSLFDN